jgi:hypothetical protein
MRSAYIRDLKALSLADDAILWCPVAAASCRRRAFGTLIVVMMVAIVTRQPVFKFGHAGAPLSVDGPRARP